MNQIRLIIILVLTLFVCNVFAQTKFDFDSNTYSELIDYETSKYDIVQIVNGITLRVTSSGTSTEITQITDYMGLYGTSGNVVSTSNNQNKVTFTFSEPVLLVRLNAINMGGTSGTHTFSDPTGTYDDTVFALNPSRDVELMWDSITSFEVVCNIHSLPAWDNIIFVPVDEVDRGNTYVPDDNFEQALIDNGDDDILDDSVSTFNIAYKNYIDLNSNSISDLTGIEDFTYLTMLWCSVNQLTTLDVSGLQYLEWIYCASNTITHLNLSNNTKLSKLVAGDNQLDYIDLTNNPDLFMVTLENNNLTSLDLSENQDLFFIRAYSNELTCLDIANGNNPNLTTFDVTDNPNLYCIRVDDSTYAASTFTDIDPQVSFNTECNCNSIPIDLNVDLLSISEDTCFNAQNDIVIASSSAVELESGSYSEIIAGQSIRFLPSFHAKVGSEVLAHITTDGSFCDVQSQTMLAVIPETKKSIDIENIENFERLEKSIKVFPNPNNGIFTTQLLNFETESQILVYDYFGKLIYSLSTIEKEPILNINQAKPGVYFVRVIESNDCYSRKIIIR